MQSLKNYRFDDLRQKIRDADLLRPLDVLLVGATGAGKSSTLNAVFGNTFCGGSRPTPRNPSRYPAWRRFSSADAHPNPPPQAEDGI